MTAPNIPSFTAVGPNDRTPNRTIIPNTGKFSFPQVSKGLEPGVHGIASLSHKGRTFRFRTNPNSFNWTYTLNKHIDQTYGGRVIQLLSTKIDDFVVEADCGGGRWRYANAIALFLRDIMIEQRDGEPATFEYTTRGWKLNVFVVSMPFEDAITEVLRTFSIQMKVQEDVSGVMTKNSLRAELRRLQNGLQFQRNEYNDPQVDPNTGQLQRSINDVEQLANVTENSIGYGATSFLTPRNDLGIVNGMPTPQAPTGG